MSSVPGVSSYDKIFGHLAECPEFRDARARWRERLSQIGFDKYDFEYSSYWDMSAGKQVHQVRTLLYATDGHAVFINRKDKDGKDALDYDLNTDFLLTDEEAEAIVRANFGTKRCRTYFCKIEKVIKGEEKGKKKHEGFASWAREKLRGESCEMNVGVREKVVSAARDALDSDQFAKDKKRFFERKVIDAIKAEVLKFVEHVDLSVVKEAMDEVVAHTVMDS